MTCIVGLVQDDKVWIGGDSAGTSAANTVRIHTEPKVFVRGPFIFGCGTSFRMAQILEHRLVLPIQPGDQPDMQFLSVTLMDAIRESFREAGYLTVGQSEENAHQEFGGFFLLGYRGHIYTVEDDFQIYEPELQFASVGSGAQVALGSLYSTLTWNSPAQRVFQALRSAAEFDTTVREPFVLKSL